MRKILNTLLILIFIISSGNSQDSKFKRKNTKLWCDCKPMLNKEGNDYQYEEIKDIELDGKDVIKRVKSYFTSNNVDIVSEDEVMIQGIIRKKIAIGKALSPSYIGIQYKLNIMVKEGKYRILIDNFNIVNSNDQVTVSAFNYQKNKSIGKKIRKQVLSQIVFHIEGFIDLGNIERFGLLEEITKAIITEDKYSDWD